MKTLYAAWAKITIAFFLLLAAVSLISGCYQTVEISPSNSSNTTAGVDRSSPVSAPTLPSHQEQAVTATADDKSPPGADTERGAVQSPTSSQGSSAAEASRTAPQAAEQPKLGEGRPVKDESSAVTRAEKRPAGVNRELSVVDKTANPKIVEGDWPQWCGTSYRNNTPVTGPLPHEWDIGRFDRKTGKWEGSVSIKWVSALGSQSYGNPVVADGRVYVGTNNNNGYLKRYPYRVDLGCLLCFRESDGEFLWQHSSEKLPTGRVHDWEQQGICCAPLVEGKHLWFVTSRGHVICLDTEGYYDGEDDGPVQNEWARLFNVDPPIDPSEPNQVAAALSALKDGQLTDYLRSEFARVEMTQPEEVKIAAEEKASNKWTIQAQIGGTQREFRLRMEGPKLAVYVITTPDDKHEADTVWDFDMMAELGVSQHNMCSCSVTALGDILFVCTSNGVDESHLNIPAPNAPSFIAMNKHTGEVLWTDKSPGTNILHGQWSSPTVATIGGVPQVMFAGGDGWLYSFKADQGNDGKPELLWMFDANPKESKYILGGRGTRNEIIATPVVYDGLVYLAVGQDPEHGEGIGHLWCIDPTKRGDVSPQLAMKIEGDKRVPIPHRRIQAVIPEEGEVAVDNPHSAVVWHYSEYDQNGDGKVDFEETMHRSIGTVAIKDDILFIADFSGLFHCLNAKTGVPYWTYDMLAAAWGSPLIADGKVYIGDEDGDVCVFRCTSERHDPVSEINMANSVYSTPIVANGVLFISNRSHLFAIEEEGAAGK